MKKTVTIIVTVYNIAPYLDRFFDCLRQQSYTDYEVLIIDDGSSDDSLAVCERYAAGDDRIKVVSVEHIGISAARNLLMEHLHTEFVTSLDGDDYFDKDYLRHLMDAQEKYHADLVISNVIYRREDGTEIRRFPLREESVITKDRFPELLPALLEEERLNYLYAKLYRADILRDVRVEPDVMQGSDTMINCRYVVNIDSIAVIEDYDYQYVKYPSRAVTSYKGKGAFERMYRINRFVYDIMQENGLLSDEMTRVIDMRILACGKSVLTHIGRSKVSLKEKYRQAEALVNSEEYLYSYRRLCKNGQIGTVPFAIAPDKARAHIDYVRNSVRQSKKDQRIKKLRSLCPDPLFDLYHKTKIRLGLIPPEKN